MGNTEMMSAKLLAQSPAYNQDLVKVHFFPSLSDFPFGALLFPSPSPHHGLLERDLCPKLPVSTKMGSDRVLMGSPLGPCLGPLRAGHPNWLAGLQASGLLDSGWWPPYSEGQTFFCSGLLTPCPQDPHFFFSPYKLAIHIPRSLCQELQMVPKWRGKWELSYQSSSVTTSLLDH